MIEIVWLPEAQQDILNIEEQIGLFDEESARLIRRQLILEAGSLFEKPEQGKVLNMLASSTVVRQIRVKINLRYYLIRYHYKHPNLAIVKVVMEPVT